MKTVNNTLIIVVSFLLTAVFNLHAQTTLEQIDIAKQEVSEGNFTTFAQLQNTISYNGGNNDNLAAYAYLDLLYDIASSNIDNVRITKALDFIESLEDEKLASDFGDFAYSIARFYRTGTVVDRDQNKAFDLVTAATANNAYAVNPHYRGDAWLMLAEMTLNGEATERNVQQAIYYFNNALKYENPKALERLQSLLDTYGNQYFNPMPNLMQQYDGVGDYTRERTAVKKYGKWGLADTNTGEAIFKARYDSITIATADNSPTLFKAKKPLLNWIVIDAEGNELLQRSYDNVIPLAGSLTSKDQSKWQFLIQQDGREGVVIDGAEVLDPIYDKIEEMTIDKQNMLLVKQNGMCGLFDANGIRRVPIAYKSISDIKSNLDETFIVAVNSDNKKVAYDLNGNKRIPANGDITYNEIVPVGNKFVALKKGAKWGINNTSDESVMPIAFNDIVVSDNLNEYFAIRLDNWVIVNTAGKVIVHPGLIKTAKQDKHGIAITTADGREMVITGDFSSRDKNPRNGFAPALINGRTTRVDVRLNEQ